jgi:Skp family chaperone for outer membrane proteins
MNEFNKRWIPVAVGAAAMAALFLARPSRSAADPPGAVPVVIGIANPEKIAESIHEYQDLVAQLDLDKKNFDSAATEKQNNVNSMKQALSFLKPDSQQYADQEDKLLKASIELEAWGKETELALQRDQKNKIKNLFLEIEDAIAQVAQKDGINLVIADQRPKIPDNIDAIDVNQLRALISQRTVLYSDQSHDISGEVITLLDKNYAAKTAPH